MTQAEHIAGPRCLHGEGPIWSPFHQRLFWLDQHGCQIHALDPISGAVDSRRFPNSICAVAPTSSSRLLAAFAKELAWVDWPSALVTGITPVEPCDSGTRCNDGKRDPAGRFWIGTMSREGDVKGAGSLYRLEDDGRLSRVLTGLTIANGLDWSADGTTMYFIDSPTREIWAFDFDQVRSGISNRRTVVRVPEALGWPDGMTIASDGTIWVAHWGAGCVARWNPINGQLLDRIDTGCPHTSSCAFAGSDGRDLYITTSQLGLPPDSLLSAPLSGSLFRARNVD